MYILRFILLYIYRVISIMIFFFLLLSLRKILKNLIYFIELNNIIIVLRFILDGWIDMYEILSMDLVILFY